MLFRSARTRLALLQEADRQARAAEERALKDRAAVEAAEERVATDVAADDAREKRVAEWREQADRGQADARHQLGLALLAAILIVYTVMVATFRSLRQPLLLLASVPFAAPFAGTRWYRMDSKIQNEITKASPAGQLPGVGQLLSAIGTPGYFIPMSEIGRAHV